jgi:hypothetical protein
MSDEQLLEMEATETTSDVQPESQASDPASPAATAPQAAPQEQSVWSSFRTLPDFKGQDDRQIAGRLYASLEREKAATKALQQYQQLIPYAQEYREYRPQFQEFLKSQQAQQAAPAPVQAQPQPKPEQSKWWNPPQVRESSKRYLVKDENGREVIDPNAPLSARDELYEFQRYKAEFAQKFLSDPQAALGPMVEEQAQRIARQIVEDQLRQVGEQGYVSTLEKDNADWLYESDGKTPTREGLMVQKYIEQAAQNGYASPQARWQYACDMVERDLLREAMENRSAPPPPQFQQQAPQGLPAPQQAALPDPAATTEPPPAQNRAEQDMNYLRREASRNPSRSAPATDPRIPKGPMTFEQRLRTQMKRDGIDY